MDTETRFDPAQLDMYVADLADTNVVTAISTLVADSARVRSAEPDWVCQAASIPVDTRFGQQWWLRNVGQYGGVVGKDLHATAAWDRSTGAAIVDVVVIDTGVDPGHPDLLGRIIPGPNYVGPGIPFDDDVTNSHGTSVAGMIAGRGDGGGTIVGVDWNANIVAVKALDATGFGYMSDVYAAVDWARAGGYKLVNLSLGDYAFSAAGQIVFKNAWLAEMALFAAMLNDDCACTAYPAGYSPFVIAVGAMDHTGQRWSDHNIWNDHGLDGLPPGGVFHGSNMGSHIDFVAPGGRFIQTSRSTSTGSYWNVALDADHTGFGSTSAAVAAASGTAALTLSLAPELSGEDLVQIIETNTDGVTGFGAGFNDKVGWGSLSADKATAAIAGQNQIEKIDALPATDVGSLQVGQVYVRDWQGLPRGSYTAVRHTMRATASFAHGFIASPTAWLRQTGSFGAGFIPNPLDEGDLASWVQSTWVTSVSSSQATFETYVYNLVPVGGGAQGWWPSIPSAVRFSYTAIGPVSLLGVGPDGREKNQLALSAGPNPVSLHSGLSFYLPVESDVVLDVLDLSGRSVRQLMHERVPAGAFRTTWDLADRDGVRVQPGVYFVTLRTDRESDTKKLVVAR